MNRLTLPVLICCAAIIAACTTIQIAPDGTKTKVPDVAKTEQVKAIAKGVVSFGIAESMYQFPKDASNIAFYARAAGLVFCDMKARGVLDPLALEDGLFNIAAPQLDDPELVHYLRSARGMLLAAYTAAYAKRWQAELDPDEWSGVVAEIFCDAIDRGLKDAGYAGVK